jgi:hypothetical protein
MTIKIFLSIFLLSSAVSLVACKREHKTSLNSESPFEIEKEIVVSYPDEISGLSFMGDEIAVVGDSSPGYFARWPSGAKIIFPFKLSDVESIDTVIDESGHQYYWVIDEDTGRLIDSTGAHYQFKAAFSEVCQRGIEGVTVKKEAGYWRVAVVWEGGYYSAKRNCVVKNNTPMIAVLKWEYGKGIIGEPEYVPLNVPAIKIGESFRVPDIAWYEDGWLVLLSSTGVAGRPRDRHTWIAKFDAEGEHVRTLIKMENDFPKIWKDQKWEAIDWDEITKRLVLGYDSRKPNKKIFILKTIP